MPELSPAKVKHWKAKKRKVDKRKSHWKNIDC